MEQKLDDMLSKEDEYAAEDTEPRPYEKRILACRHCGYQRSHEYIPHRRAWHCTNCGGQWATPERIAELAKNKTTADDIWGG